jgi:glycosyltransferase involved in cell wall biosynthesis
VPRTRQPGDELHERSGYAFELIVHDDGSAPHVREELYKLHDEGQISTLLLNPTGHNQGQGIALNRMFRMAKGDPIIKLDQDLVYDQGWLLEVMSLMAIDRRLGLLGLFHYLHEPVDSSKTILVDHGRWQEHTHICGSGFAVSRKCWEDLGPFEEHSEAFAEDWTFQNKVTASANYCCGLPEHDLVENRGFGIGPSTVVVAEGTVQTIHKAPVIYR